MQKFQELKDLIASLEEDMDKFCNKGNSAAGTRIRKGMQDPKNLAQAIRSEVQEIKNKAKALGLLDFNKKGAFDKAPFFV